MRRPTRLTRTDTPFPYTPLFRSTGYRRRSHRNRLGSWRCARVLVPEGSLSGGRHLDPLLVGCSVRDVAIVPVPPLIGRGLRIALGRVLPDQIGRAHV